MLKKDKLFKQDERKKNNSASGSRTLFRYPVSGRIFEIISGSVCMKKLFSTNTCLPSHVRNKFCVTMIKKRGAGLEMNIWWCVARAWFLY